MTCRMVRDLCTVRTGDKPTWVVDVLVLIGIDSGVSTTFTKLVLTAHRSDRNTSPVSDLTLANA